LVVSVGGAIDSNGGSDITIETKIFFYWSIEPPSDCASQEPEEQTPSLSGVQSGVANGASPRLNVVVNGVALVNGWV
jgi:hypothetical protein